MLKINDTVKVIDKHHYSDGKKEEYIPIDTVCIVKEISYEENGTPYYGILPVDEKDTGFYFCYLENELEKGHMEWIIEKEMAEIVDGVTTCCGYDFGVDFSEAKYCPICGRKLMKDN